MIMIPNDVVSPSGVFSIGFFHSRYNQKRIMLWIDVCCDDAFMWFRIITADRKSTRLNSSHVSISYAVFCLKKKKRKTNHAPLYRVISVGSEWLQRKSRS